MAYRDVAALFHDSAQLSRDWPQLLHDTPADCLFDEVPMLEDNPPPQRLEGFDKRDYDHWRTLRAKALYSATREDRDRIRAEFEEARQRMESSSS